MWDFFVVSAPRLMFDNPIHCLWSFQMIVSIPVSFICIGKPRKRFIRWFIIYLASFFSSLVSSINQKSTLIMIPFDNKSVFNTFLYIRYTLAVSGNFMVLRILGSFPALRTPANMLVMNLAVFDFLLMITLFPEECYNFFTGGGLNFMRWTLKITLVRPS